MFHGPLHPPECLIVQFHNSWGWPQKWHRGTVVVQAVGQRTLGMPMERGGFHGHVCHPVLGPPKRGLRANLGPHCRPGTCLHCRGYSLRTVRDRGDLSTLFYRQFFPKNPKKYLQSPKPKPKAQKAAVPGCGAHAPTLAHGVWFIF